MIITGIGFKAGNPLLTPPAPLSFISGSLLDEIQTRFPAAFS
jgi:hypothetical protein